MEIEGERGGNGGKQGLRGRGEKWKKEYLLRENGRNWRKRKKSRDWKRGK